MKDTLTIEIRSRSAQPWFNQMWVPNRNSVADGYSKRIGTINQIGEFSLFFYFFCWICCIFFCSFVNGYFCAIFKCLFVYFTKLLTLFFPWIIHRSFFFAFSVYFSNVHWATVLWITLVWCSIFLRLFVPKSDNFWEKE